MRKKNPYQPLITGLLLVLWLGFSFSDNPYHYSDTLGEKDQKEETNPDDKDPGHQFTLTEAVQPTIQINVAFQSFLVEELLKLEVPDVGHNHEFRTRLPKSFRILFRKIISPNAP